MMIRGLALALGMTAAAATNSTTGMAARRLQSAADVLVDGLEFASNEIASLALSGDGILALLSRISTSGIVTPAGRSYDGFAWEGVHPLTLQFDCDGNSCSTNLPGSADEIYRLDIHTADQAATDAQAAARFLLHTTFGPTISEVNAITDGLDFAGWIGDQIAMVRTQPMRPFAMLWGAHSAWLTVRLNFCVTACDTATCFCEISVQQPQSGCWQQRLQHDRTGPVGVPARLALVSICFHLGRRRFHFLSRRKCRWWLQSVRWRSAPHSN